ncbi:C2H2 type zinc-finger-domain-containing protein [Tirmania nivea]|nr:C2H2 type zinc-finger-domain-containing protein [Tirmania nivea]
MTSVLSPNAAVGAPPAAAAALLSSHPFTCNTCQVAFRSSEQQRSHMHTDWHRYNLKRRITSLPPLASEVFAEKVLHIQATNRIEHERATFCKECKTCSKTYFSENAFNNHLGSSKHKQNVAAEKLGIKPKKESVEGDKDETGSVISSTFSLGTAEGEESESSKEVGMMEKVKEEGEEETKEAQREFVEMVRGMKISEEKQKGDVSTGKGKGKEAQVEKVDENEEDEPTPLPLEECLFCNYTSPTLQLNVSHMSKAHGLFIPEQNYLVDLPGLVRYLGEKVAILHECLYCGKMKSGLEGVRMHMRDVGHCKIAFETEEEQVEVGEFYDFRSTYEGVDASDSEDGEEEEEIKPHRRRSSGGIRSNKKAETGFTPEDGYVDGEDDAGWETDSSASSLDSTELCAVPLAHHTHSGDSSQDGKDGHHHHHAHPLRHHAHGPAHHHVHHPSVVYHTEYELHLLSGRTAGHRSLARYYRQNLSHPLSEQLARQPARWLLQDLAPTQGDEGVDAEDADSFSQPEELTRRERRDLFFGRMSLEDQAAALGAERARRQERGLGGTARGELGMVGVSEQKRRMVKEEERRARGEERRGRGRGAWRIDRVGNMQKHYRDALLQ